MKNSIGFVVPSVEENEKSKNILNIIDRISSSTPYSDCVVFNSLYSNYSPMINKFGVLHLNEAKFFLGPMIAFDLASMLFLKSCVTSHKIFFPLELEWQKYVNFNHDVNDPDYEKLSQYFGLRELYVNNSLLVTDNIEHKKILDLCWKESLIIENNNYEKIFEYIKL
jgi:hypothetical protein